MYANWPAIYLLIQGADSPYLLDGLGSKTSESVNAITAEIFTGADKKNILGQDKSAVSHPGLDLFVFSSQLQFPKNCCWQMAASLKKDAD